MADDQAQAILSPAQAENSAKADAWEAFHSAQNENELGVRLQGMKLPQDVKAQLWEAKKSSSFQIPDANAQAKQTIQGLPAAFDKPNLTDLAQRRYYEKGGASGLDKSPLPGSFEGKPENVGDYIPQSAGQMYQGGKDILQGNYARGGSKIIGGAGNALLPFAPFAVAAAPGAALLGTGGGMLGGYGAKKGAEVLGATPDQAQFAGDIGSLIGGYGAVKGSGVVRGQLAKLSGETPERLATLKALPAQEAAINQRVVQAEAASRTAFKNAYDSMGIDAAPVNVAATKNLAKQAASKIVSSGVPAPVGRVAAIPEPSANVLTSDDPATILKELSSFDNIPFRKAQLYRTAIEQYISRAGGKLPSDVYGQLKAVSGSLGDGLRATATQEGKLAQFNAAEAMTKQHAADFWNKGAPLKALVNTPPDATGQTLNKFMQTANRARITQALERRGVDTSDIKAMLAQGDKPLKANIRDAAKIQQLGPDVFNQQVGAANKAAVKSVLKKYAGGAIGAGTLYEIYKILSGDGGTNTSAIKP